MLRYHTYYGEFAGDTAADIVQQLYEDSRQGIGPDLTKQKWWDYQRTAWKLRVGKKLPATVDKKGAPEAFIAFMVKIGALEEGPKVSTDAAPRR